MAAFVAVADDASAVVWNPSGLGAGPVLQSVVRLRATCRQRDLRVNPQLTGSAGRQARHAAGGGAAAVRAFVLSHGNDRPSARQPCRPTQPEPTRSPSLSALVVYEPSGRDGAAVAWRPRDGWRNRQARARQSGGGHHGDQLVVGRLRICRVARNPRVHAGRCRSWRAGHGRPFPRGRRCTKHHRTDVREPDGAECRPAHSSATCASAWPGAIAGPGCRGRSSRSTRTRRGLRTRRASAATSRRASSGGSKAGVSGIRGGRSRQHGGRCAPGRQRRRVVRAPSGHLCRCVRRRRARARIAPGASGRG